MSRTWHELENLCTTQRPLLATNNSLVACSFAQDRPSKAHSCKSRKMFERDSGSIPTRLALTSLGRMQSKSHGWSLPSTQSFEGMATTCWVKLKQVQLNSFAMAADPDSTEHIFHPKGGHRSSGTGFEPPSRMRTAEYN